MSKLGRRDFAAALAAGGLGPLLADNRSLPRRGAAQNLSADYERAKNLRKKYESLAQGIPGKVTWIDAHRFWYRKFVKGGHEFAVVDVDTVIVAPRPAFDHARLAAALSHTTNKQHEALDLNPERLRFVDHGKAIEFISDDALWKADLATYSCEKIRALPDYEKNRVAVAKPPKPAPPPDTSDRPVASPDGRYEVFIRNYNVFVRGKGKQDAAPLSFDSSADNYYDAASIRWSPDSKKLAVYRIRHGYHRTISYVESSPTDQLQPKYITLEYEKPGDVIDLPQPVLFHLESKQSVPIDNALFPNPFELSNPVWRKDSHAFTFEYNQRGHQLYRVIEVDAQSGQPRVLINEQPKTFFCYSGKKFRHDVDDGAEIVWMSERDGWNHLYLYDGRTGEVKNQITRGEWVVREVAHVDDRRGQIYFAASGMYPGKDVYLVHYYRIDFDGTGLVPLTHTDADHIVSFSPDIKYYTDTWSRIDIAPVSELRRVDNQALVATLERGDIQDLVKSGWCAPEPFVAKGRDSKTDIYGVIIRPENFDPSKKYPVLESIYAGPQDSFVPHSFRPYYQMQAMAELGFVIVQIDGMGTSNRSKVFHDVCWKNLADAGFPDRILWHKAVAEKYSWYDISRVGIYGHSAGGQNALGGLLFYSEFYKAGVASCGCHDNRMDKIWWNEQWMGWPLGPQYAACSNVESAHRLKGKLLLSVGELDMNVDPASTMQVVNALIKANKTFDLLVLPGESHSPGGDYGARKGQDFFVRHLLGVEPPDWNQS